LFSHTSMWRVCSGIGGAAGVARRRRESGQRHRSRKRIEFTWAQVFEPGAAGGGAVGGGRAYITQGHVTAEVTPGRGRNWISWRWCMREIMALDRMGKCVPLTTHTPPPDTRHADGGGPLRGWLIIIVFISP